MYLKDQGCLLRKSPSGENHFLMVFFLRENGLMTALARRRSRSTAQTCDPDLFESGEVGIEKRGGSKPAFLREFIPHARFQGIARSYRALQAASRLTKFYEKNLVHMEFYDSAWDLLHTALGSFSSRNQPEVILLKSLFVFARSEGYAVREQWLDRFPPDSRREIVRLIQSPVDTASISPEQAGQWVRDIEQFFIHHTDILLPD